MELCRIRKAGVISAAITDAGGGSSASLSSISAASLQSGFTVHLRVRRYHNDPKKNHRSARPLRSLTQLLWQMQFMCGLRQALCSTILT
jgi:hypothetical protein